MIRTARRYPLRTRHRLGHMADSLAPEHIVCVECGGRCGRLTHERVDEPFIAGDIVAYRCADCMDRFDMELAEPEDATGDFPPQF